MHANMYFFFYVSKWSVFITLKLKLEQLISPSMRPREREVREYVFETVSLSYIKLYFLFY